MRDIVLVVLLTLPACAAATLTEAGSHVRVMKADPPAGCQEIGAVSGGDSEKIAIRNSAGENLAHPGLPNFTSRRAAGACGRSGTAAHCGMSPRCQSSL